MRNGSNSGSLISSPENDSIFLANSVDQDTNIYNTSLLNVGVIKIYIWEELGRMGKGKTFGIFTLYVLGFLKNPAYG